MQKVIIINNNKKLVVHIVVAKAKSPRFEFAYCCKVKLFQYTYVVTHWYISCEVAIRKTTNYMVRMLY